MTNATIAKAVNDAVTLNSAYLMEDEDGARFPWLQASIYKPSKVTSEIDLIVAPAAIDLLAEGALDDFGAEPVEINFGEAELAFKLTNARWVILSKPQSGYAQKVDDGSIIKVYKGLLFGDEWKSVGRVYLGCVTADTGKVMLDADGNVQVWSLKLKGLKTQWIDGKGVDRSIAKLNKGLCKHYGLKRGWATHMASVAIDAFPREFKSSKSKKQSSLGVMFGFAEGDNARPLAEENQKLVFEFVNSDEYKELSADPFGLSRQPAPEVPAPDEFEDEGEEENDVFDDIPY